MVNTVFDAASYLASDVCLSNQKIIIN